MNKAIERYDHCMAGIIRLWNTDLDMTKVHPVTGVYEKSYPNESFSIKVLMGIE